MALPTSQAAAVPALAALFARVGEGWFGSITQDEWERLREVFGQLGALWLAVHDGPLVSVFADRSPGPGPGHGGLMAPGHGLAAGVVFAAETADRIQASAAVGKFVAGHPSGGLRPARAVAPTAPIPDPVAQHIVIASAGPRVTAA